MVDAGMGAHKSAKVFMFLGPNSKTADQEALGKAQELIDAGVSRSEVLQETGWFRGVDGKWRHEIDGSGARVSLPTAQKPGDRPTLKRLSAAFDHPELLEAYPELKGVPVFQADLGKARGQISGAFGNGSQPMMTISPTADDPVSTALHESQHLVQQMEGFARGASGASGANAPAYRRAAGEVEARNVEARLGMTKTARREFPPWMTQDTHQDRQLIELNPGPARTRGADTLRNRR